MGRLDDAIGEAKRAQEIEPLAPFSPTLIGRILYYARRYDQAIAQLQKPLELDPSLISVHYWLARAFIMKSEYQEAIAELQNAVSLSGRSPVMLAALGHAYAISDKPGEARKLLEGLDKLSKQRYVPSYNIAEIYAGLGEKDRAFELLQKAYTERTDLLIWLNVDPVWDGLRLDPRFADLVQRMGLPQ